MRAAFAILIIAVVAAAMVLFRAADSDAVIGDSASKHNMTELQGYGFGTSVCASCHKPHFKSAKRLWTEDKEAPADGLRDLAPAKAASLDQAASGEYPGIYLCLDCHGGGGGPSWASPAASAKTHSTLEMQAAGYTTKRASFVIQCTGCHDPHIYWNGSFQPGRNGYMIRSTINTPNSGPRTVVFTAFTGPGSMGTNTSPYQAVCEVCHTTTLFHKNNGGNNHHDGENCTKCHRHDGGFAGTSCDACHGNPPAAYGSLVGRADNPGPAPTGATTPGKHLFHVLSTMGGAGYGCPTCHRGGMGDGEDEDGEIDVRFGFSGHTSGSFDGFTPISGYTFSPGNTTGGSLACVNTYCHGNFDGGNKTNAPVWDDASTGDCGTCHGTAPPALADHSVHLTAPWGPRAACDDCHPVDSNVGRHSGHVDGQVEFKDGKGLAATTVCNGCHGTTAAAKPTWGDISYRGQTGWCESCHDGSSTVNTQAGTSGVDVSAPNVVGDGLTYGFDVTGHGKVSIGLYCVICHLFESVHIDGSSPTYSASANNFKAGYRLDRYNNTPNLGNYSSSKVDLCYLCHIESRIVGMPAEGRPSGLHMHTVVVSDKWYTNFRNTSTTDGQFAGNWDSNVVSGYTHDVPTNIHWNHMDDYGSEKRVNQVLGGSRVYDSDGNGTADSNITCEACHDPHGTNYAPMVLDDFSLYTYSVPPNPSYRWIGSTTYLTTRCTIACHTSGNSLGTAGTRYYREPVSGSTVFGVPWGLQASPLP